VLGGRYTNIQLLSETSVSSIICGIEQGASQILIDTDNGAEIRDGTNPVQFGGVSADADSTCVIGPSGPVF